MRKVLLPALLMVGLVAACAGLGTDRTTPPPAPQAGEQLYEATGVVLENRAHGPHLCFALLESLPPQCDGVPLRDWDWKGVGAEERHGDTTWGSYHLTGTYDGEAFTVTEAGPAGDPAPSPWDRPIDTPCPEPAEGWVAIDPTRATEQELDGRIGRLREEADFAGVWIDHLGEPPATDTGDRAPGAFVLNVAFTGRLDQHTAELREWWGGPLCVVRYERTEAELIRIQRELSSDFGKDLGLHIITSGVAEPWNEVVLEVLIVEPSMQAELDARYGEGVVRLSAALRPVP